MTLHFSGSDGKQEIDLEWLNVLHLWSVWAIPAYSFYQLYDYHISSKSCHGEIKFRGTVLCGDNLMVASIPWI